MIEFIHVWERDRETEGERLMALNIYRLTVHESNWVKNRKPFFHAEHLYVFQMELFPKNNNPFDAYIVSNCSIAFMHWAYPPKVTEK